MPSSMSHSLVIHEMPLVLLAEGKWVFVGYQRQFQFLLLLTGGLLSDEGAPAGSPNISNRPSNTAFQLHSPYQFSCARVQLSIILSSCVPVPSHDKCQHVHAHSFSTRTAICQFFSARLLKCDPSTGHPHQPHKD